MCLTTWKQPQRNATVQHLLQASPTQRNCPLAPGAPTEKHLAGRDSRGSSEESGQSPETSGGGRELDPSKGTRRQRGQRSVSGGSGVQLSDDTHTRTETSCHVTSSQHTMYNIFMSHSLFRWSSVWLKSSPVTNRPPLACRGHLCLSV